MLESLSAASLKSMARDAGLSFHDLTFLAETVQYVTQREAVLSFGVTDPPKEPILYFAALLPSGQIEVVIDIPSLDATATGLAREHPDISLVAFYDALLENAPYETLQDGQTIYTPLAPKWVPFRDAFLRKHQWHVIRPES